MISNFVKTDRGILEYSHTIGIFADEGRGFQKPVDLVFDKHGRILVLNRAANWARIGICNLDEEYLGEIDVGYLQQLCQVSRYSNLGKINKKGV